MKKTAQSTARSRKLDEKMLKDYPGLMSAEQVREVLNIGRTGMYQLLKDGEIQSLFIRGKYRIPKQYLLDYIHENTCGGRH